LGNDKTKIVQFKFWDCGSVYAKKYDYLGKSMKENPNIIVFSFAIPDRSSWDEVLNNVILQGV
jgi:hypothetical protein